MNKINLKKHVDYVARGVQTTVVTAAAGATLIAFTAIPSFTIELINTSVTQSLPKLLSIKIDSVDRETGDFSGEVSSEDDRGDVWEMVGTVEGSKIEFELESLKTSERIVATGKVDEDGEMAGIAADTTGTSYEWEKAS